MTTGERIVSVTIGIAAIVWAFVPGVKFYPGGFGIVNRERTIPKWQGRLLFVIVGLVFIYFGLR
jgi:hypothetical protein